MIEQWELTMILMVSAASVVAPLVAIATDHSDEVLDRTGWWLWTVSYFVLSALHGMFDDLAKHSLETGSMTASETVYWIVTAAFLLAFNWFMARRFLWRVCDAGWSRGFAYLFAVPLIGFVPWLILLFVPSAGDAYERASPAY